jgi:anti-sigma factor RsiW
MDIDMRSTSFHVSEQELMLAADGELPARRMANVQAHLATCWTCRARMSEIEGAIVDFVQARRHSLEQGLPPAAGTRARFRARLAALANSTQGRQGFFPLLPGRVLPLTGLAAGVIVLAVISLKMLSLTEETRRSRTPA